LKAILHIGYVPTVGMKTGVMQDSSKLKEEVMNAELKVELSLDKFEKIEKR